MFIIIHEGHYFILDLPADEVHAIYREFWELKGMYRLAQIYDEAKYDLRDLLRLHKTVNDLGLGGTGNN
jgi:hypothetical protein